MLKHNCINPLKCSGVRQLHSKVLNAIQVQTTFLISDIRAALRAERQSAQMADIKNVGYTWMAKCNQLTPMPFKGLNTFSSFHI